MRRVAAYWMPTSIVLAVIGTISTNQAKVAVLAKRASSRLAVAMAPKSAAQMWPIRLGVLCRAGESDSTC